MRFYLQIYWFSYFLAYLTWNTLYVVDLYYFIPPSSNILVKSLWFYARLTWPSDYFSICMPQNKINVSGTLPPTLSLYLPLSLSLSLWLIDWFSRYNQFQIVFKLINDQPFLGKKNWNFMWRGSEFKWCLWAYRNKIKCALGKADET